MAVEAKLYFYSPPVAGDEEGVSRIVVNFYSRMYQSGKEDSPVASRVSLRRRFRAVSGALDEGDIVLDLGGGRQIFERDYIKTYGRGEFKFLSLDIAAIGKKQLLVGGEQASHIRADGSSLPVRDNSIAAVVSSMALDFMPNEAVDELSRVLKDDGKVIVNLHHPSLIPSEIDELLNAKKLRRSRRDVLIFWKHLVDNNILFETEGQIRDRFEQAGFRMESVREAADGRDRWWEVDMDKRR